MKPTQNLEQKLNKRFNYNKEKLINNEINYSIYLATDKQTKMTVTLKIIKNYDIKLLQYLKKLKTCKSQQIINIQDLYIEQNQLYLITQQVTYGNLKQAMIGCDKLDDNDGIFISKILLNGYVEMLRNGLEWKGDQKDIEITDSGIKMSWNNNNIENKEQYPLKSIIQRLTHNSSENLQKSQILPFPISKNIIQIIKISTQNASQISLNQIMKKKDKYIKKKGRNWIALKETKNDNQYYEQIIYLAIHKDIGLCKIKIYQKGIINQDILHLNKTKNTFIKIFEIYNDQNKTIIISQYSNNGSLSSYILKLKTSGIVLKEDQIEFFFYSLFQPLKYIQNSNIKSINMLHIRNIYIQNGIPKLGQPVPLNSKIESLLKDRADVPDFYHGDFKRAPQTHQNTYDTYSLGVLLYKLMYTEYPIFPNNKVHIPTTPSYNKRLKTTLEIFLNEGGTLRQIEKKIEVSENVAQQVKLNKQLLIQKKSIIKKNKIKINKKSKFQNELIENQHQKKQIQFEQQQQQQFCCKYCCIYLNFDEQQNNKNNNNYYYINFLEQSPYKMYRICTKIIIIIIFYTFLFYFFYLQSNFQMLTQINNLQTLKLTLSTSNYSIIVSSSHSFYSSFNITNRTVQALQNLNCLIDNFQNNGISYSSFIHKSSLQWTLFLFGGLITYVIIIIFKIVQLIKMDLIKTIYYYQNKISNFNISNFIVHHLLWACFINMHFQCFNLIFYQQIQLCMGSRNSHYFASSIALLQNRANYLLIYFSSFLILLLALFSHFCMLWNTLKIHYNKILNPIMIFSSFILLSWIIIRIGVIPNIFTPNALHDQSNIIHGYFQFGDYIGILGFIPEIMILFELLIGAIIDWIYWGVLDKRRRILIQQTSNSVSYIS